LTDLETEDVVSYESFSEEEIVKPVKDEIKGPKKTDTKNTEVKNTEARSTGTKRIDTKKKGGKQQTSLLSYFQKK
jgi:DNA polymerase subunit Cdc27